MMRLKQLFYLFLTIFISGCWAATIPHEVPKSLGDPDMLEPLIGKHYENVIEIFGPPELHLNHEDRRYMIYHTLGEGTNIIFVLWIPFPVLDQDLSKDSALHCLRIEFGEDDLVKKYKIKSGGWHGPCNLRGACKSYGFNLKCQKMFWSANEINNLQYITESESEQHIESTEAKAQLELYKSLVDSKPKLALSWLCRSADGGNSEAAYRIGRFFELGHDRWDMRSENFEVQKDFIQAYIWYSRSSWYDKQYLPSFVEQYLSPEQHIRAKKALSSWEPGHCERKIVVTETRQ